MHRLLPLRTAPSQITASQQAVDRSECHQLSSCSCLGEKG